jgi:hypothetical protein
MGMGLEEAKALGVSSRLPSYFTFALQEEWRKGRATYEPIQKFLDTPFIKAQERELLCSLYAAWLSRLADRRMFDETFSLRQVFVPLRAAFEKKANGNRDCDSRPAIGDSKKPKKQAVFLQECLDAWLERWDGQDGIRVLSGGPGSGKSSFARLYAALVAGLGHCRVIYVPLHELQIKANLAEAVHEFCKFNEYLPTAVLDAKEGEQRLLLIFDGLDELEKQGRMAAQVATEFVQEVERTVSQRNSTNSRLMVLLCGRPIAVQASESVLRREEQILHLLPYVLTEAERKEYEDPMDILAEDQRDQWWKKYGSCVLRCKSVVSGAFS